jgi:hypothetical protein
MKALTVFALTAAAAVLSSPAMAVSYDAFSSFNGTQGAGNFTYGSVDDAVTAGTLFTANTNCFIAGSICLQAAPNNDVPGATRSSVTSFQYGSVNVPTDRLLLHPGPTAADGGVFITFTAPTSAYYSFAASFSVQDIHPTGVDLIFRQQSGASPALFFGAASLGSNNLTYNYSGSTFLNAGDVLSTIINRQGNYGSDSTGENFTVSVPEPASWAMMLAGFGLMGGAMRRRRTNLTFA